MEYCDISKKVISKKIPFRFSKTTFDNSIYYLYSIRNVKHGTWSVDNNEFTVVLTSSMLDFDLNSKLMIDSDKNHQFDNQDISAPLFQPFSFKGNSYELGQIDPMEKYLILQKTNVPVVEIGYPAPDFDSPTVDAKSFKLSDYRGKYVLIDFWATWCGPCVGEIPTLKDVYTRFKDKGLVMVGVAIHEDPDKVKTYARKNDLNWFQICQEDNEIMKLYQVSAVPTAFLINPDGVLVNQGNELRGENLKSTLEKYFKKD